MMDALDVVSNYWRKTTLGHSLLGLFPWAKFTSGKSVFFLFVITSRFPISKPFISYQDHVKPHISYIVGNGMLWCIIWRWQRHTQRQNIFRFHPSKTSWCWEFPMSSNTSGQVKTSLYLFSKTYKFIFLLFSETYKYLYSRHIQANVPPPEKTKERSNKLSRKGSKASINGAKWNPTNQDLQQQKITNLCGFVLKTLSECLCLFKDFLPLTSPHF